MQTDTFKVDIKVPNQTRYLSLIGKIGEDIAKELDRYSGDRETLAYHINLALTEATVNAIKYGKNSNPDKMVRIMIKVSDEEIGIKVYDHGQGFDINSVPSPNFEAPDDRGRGIFLIKSLMDSVCYQQLPNGNILEMTKKLN